MTKVYSFEQAYDLARADVSIFYQVDGGWTADKGVAINHSIDRSNWDKYGRYMGNKMFKSIQTGEVEINWVEL